MEIKHSQHKPPQSLARLLELAVKEDTGQASVAAKLLMNLYDSDYPFDLIELCRFDEDLFADAIVALRIRVQHRIEPHEFYDNGHEIFEHLQTKWNLQPVPQETVPA